jgi:hypothetical protein
MDMVTPILKDFWPVLMVAAEFKSMPHQSPTPVHTAQGLDNPPGKLI